MSIKVGDIDLANEVIELHYQLIRTQLLLEEIVNSNPSLLRPNADRMRNVDERALQAIQQKFPNMGITRK